MNKENLIKADIYQSSGRIFICKTFEHGVIEAEARGLLHRKMTLVAGDRVLLEKSDDSFHIVELIPRKNEIFRYVQRERIKKVTASNVDLLAIMFSVSLPAYRRSMLDRFLVRAMQWNVKPVVIYSKMDEVDKKVDWQAEFDYLSSMNIEHFQSSAKDSSAWSIGDQDRLKLFLKGKRVLFTGSSGVGKSSLVNYLTDGKSNLKEGILAKKSKKGAHTTTWSELIDCDDFVVVDTPGIRSFSLSDIDPEELIQYYPRVWECSLKCKFQDCSHEKNSTGCAFYSEENSKDNFLHTRLRSYLDLFNEIEAQALRPYER